MIGGCLVFDEPDLIDTPRSFPITSGPLSQLFILCCIENIERCEISFAFWRLGGGFKIYCDTWGGVWGRTNGHLGATTPTPCVVIIVIIVITNILVIIIMVTRPKPPSGRQGLVGSWGKDTVRQVHYKMFSMSHFTPTFYFPLSTFYFLLSTFYFLLSTFYFLLSTF